MTNKLVFVLTLFSAFGCGLIGGVFFAFSNFVMKALAGLPPSQGIAAMKSINVTVLNPMFLGVFLGAAGSCLILAVCSVLAWQKPGSCASGGQRTVFTGDIAGDDRLQCSA